MLSEDFKKQPQKSILKMLMFSNPGIINDSLWIEYVKTWSTGKINLIGFAATIINLSALFLVVPMQREAFHFLSELSSQWRNISIWYWGISGLLMAVFGAPLGSSACEFVRRTMKWWWEWIESDKESEIVEKLSAFRYGYRCTIWWTRIMGVFLLTVSVLMIYHKI
jgi:hypothetical protein